MVGVHAVHVMHERKRDGRAYGCNKHFQAKQFRCRGRLAVHTARDANTSALEASVQCNVQLGAGESLFSCYKSIQSCCSTSTGRAVSWVSDTRVCQITVSQGRSEARARVQCHLNYVPVFLSSCTRRRLKIPQNIRSTNAYECVVCARLRSQGRGTAPRMYIIT